MRVLASDRPTSARWVVVDDTSSRINYTVQVVWSAQKISPTLNQGPYGRPYNDTLHVLAPLAGDSSRGLAGLSFSFSGVAVAVYITNNLPNITGANGVDCWIDGIKSQVDIKPTANGSAINNYMVCDASSLADGTHEISVVPNASLDFFFFDRIQYRPSASASLENKMVYVNSFDESMTFGDGWKGTEGAWYSYTATRGSTFEFEFTGVSLAWYGIISAQGPVGSASNFTYTIDGGSPQFVNLPSHTVGSYTLQNQKFFEVSSLSMNKHNVSVVYHGDNTTTHLTLDYLLVQNGTLTDVTRPPDTTPANLGTKHKSKHLGPIIGCVVTAVVCIALLAISYLYYRRRKRPSKGRSDKLVERVATHVEPFPVAGTIQEHQLARDHDGATSSKTSRVQVNVNDLSSVALSYAPVPSQHDGDSNTDANEAPLSPSGVIRHQDSGVRLREQRSLGSGVPVPVELPPDYTPA